MPEKISMDEYEEHFRVTIFGSARIHKDDRWYKEIEKLAAIIAEEGIDIVTGGGPGIMEAANKGHKEGRKQNQVKSFGLNIKLPKEQQANRHLDIKKDFERFSERLDYFMYLSNVVIVGPGGIGTLLELFYSWQLVQVKHICNMPIILFGDMYVDFVGWIKNWPLRKKFLDQDDMKLIFVAKNSAEVMEIVKRFHNSYKKDGNSKIDNADCRRYKLRR